MKWIIRALLIGLSATALANDPAVSSADSDSALNKLKEGNARFAGSTTSTARPTAAKRAETAQGQHPFAVILGCADSRVSPEIIFDQNIGDLFVIRTAGDLVDDHALGSIEYAVEHLGTRLVVVLGHTKCGAVTAAVASSKAPGHIQSLVDDIEPAVEAVQGKAGDTTELAVKENARRVAEAIRKRADLGELAKEVRIIFAIYDLASGKIEWGGKG
jgi:carbonic anhydrase